MATAVDESARPPPSTIAAGPDAPSTAITVYATNASVTTTWARPACRERGVCRVRVGACHDRQRDHHLGARACHTGKSVQT